MQRSTKQPIERMPGSLSCLTSPLPVILTVAWHKSVLYVCIIYIMGASVFWIRGCSFLQTYHFITKSPVHVCVGTLHAAAKEWVQEWPRIKRWLSPYSFPNSWPQQTRKFVFLTTWLLSKKALPSKPQQVLGCRMIHVILQIASTGKRIQMAIAYSNVTVQCMYDCMYGCVCMSVCVWMCKYAYAWMYVWRMCMSVCMFLYLTSTNDSEKIHRMVMNMNIKQLIS